MPATTKKHVRKELNANVMASQQFAQVFRAFLECSDEVQAAIQDMIEIVNDPEATEEETMAALETIAEALFPSSHNGAIGTDLDESEEEAPVQISKKIDMMCKQEETFSARVSSLLREQKISQEELAARIGIGQPAISMLLSRKCRPQRRTVERIASALGVQASDIWPALEE